MRNRYNHVPQLTQDTAIESDKTQLYNTKERAERPAFPRGDHKAVMNRRESMTTQYMNNTNDPQKYLLGTASKIFTGGLKPVSRH